MNVKSGIKLRKMDIAICNWWTKLSIISFRNINGFQTIMKRHQPATKVFKLQTVTWNQCVLGLKELPNITLP